MAEYLEKHPEKGPQKSPFYGSRTKMLSGVYGIPHSRA
jgi:hypothetical protein